MKGKLLVKNKEERIFNSTIYDVISHLENIQHIEFSKAEKTGADYWDAVRGVYEKTKSNNTTADQALIPIFYEKLNALFQSEDTSIQDKLSELGVTALDKALITCDISNIQQITGENTTQNIYQLAKKYRFLEIARTIHGEIFKDADTVQLQLELWGG
jgi:hypothetical protein